MKIEKQLKKKIQNLQEECKIFATQQNFEKAIETNQELLKILDGLESNAKETYKHEIENACSNLAELYAYKRIDLEKAHHFIERCLSYNSNNPQYYNVQFSVYYDLGHTEKVIEALTNTIRCLNKEWGTEHIINCLNNRADAYKTLGQFEKAKEDILAAEQLDPNFEIQPIVTATGFQIFALLNDKKEMFRYLKLAIEKYYFDIDVFLNNPNNQAILQNYQDNIEFQTLIEDYKTAKVKEFAHGFDLPTNLAKTAEDFFAKHGENQKLDSNQRWLESRMMGNNFYKPDKNATPPLFNGFFWTTGYHKSEENPNKVRDWQALDYAYQVAKTLEKALSKCELSSDTDCKYYPFVLDLNFSNSFDIYNFKQALGYQKNSPEDFDWRCTPIAQDKKQFFYNNDGWYMDDEIEESFSEEQLHAYKNATFFMLETLTNLKFTSPSSDHVVFPSFWIGETPHGYVAGVWALAVYS